MRRRRLRRDDRGLALPRVTRRRRKPGKLRSSVHRSWLATLSCRACHTTAARAALLGQRIEAAHLRDGTDGGMGRKPSDYFCWPGCTNCHRRQHSVGEPAFFAALGLAEPVRMTLLYALRSPCLRTRAAGLAEFKRRYE